MTKAKALPSSAELHELLSYDPDTGFLFWKPRKGTSRGDLCFNKRFAGTKAGTVRKNGDRKDVLVIIRGKRYGAHRVIYKMLTGSDPVEDVDHINCNSADNRACNLRAATTSQNCCNKKVPSSNTSGIKNVRQLATGRWRATLQVRGRKIQVGRFATPEEAEAAVQAAREKAHGEFARHA